MPSPIGNVDRLAALLEASGYDAVIALSPENFPFTAGCFVWTQASLRDRLALTVWVRGESQPVAIVCEVEAPQVRADSWVKDIRTYVEFHESPMDRVAEVLGEKGVAEGKIGLEMKYISAAYFSELTERVPQAQFSACEDLFYEARMIKTPAEIDLLTRAARATEKALLATYATIEVGETEKMMANRLAANMRHCGLDQVSFLYANIGPNTGYPHQDPTDYQARPGDMVKSDVGGLLKGYPSDVARTAVIGQPTADQRSIYSRLVEVHTETIDMARPGIRACDLFNTAREGYARRNIPFTLPHAGHGIGIEVHEEPVLTALNRTQFQPNMMLYIETRVRWVGEAGYHVEDLVLITEEGPKVLTTYFDGTELFVI